MKFVNRGFHVYRVYWEPVVGELLTTEPETDGEKYSDKRCVAVKKITVGHIPKDISRLAKFFIVHGRTITCKITSKRQRSKLSRGGLEVPCNYIFKLNGKDAIMNRLKEKLGSTTKTW